MGAEGELLRRIQAALQRADIAADALVDEAWEAARTEVRAVLQRAFQHELLDRVADVLEQGAPQRTPRTEAPAGPAPAPAQRASSSDEVEATATYVFGITRTAAMVDDDLPRIPGGGPVRAVDQDGLRAVVCDADRDALRSPEELGPDDLDRLAAAANAHDEVLARVAAQGPVLPLRLGTALSDDDVVRALLVANRDTLRAELDRVDGHAEWAVVVRVTDRVVTDDDGAEEADSGGAYLRHRQAALAAREGRREARARLATEIHDRLASFAVAAQTVEKRPLEQVPPALHGVYLLPWDRIGPFEAAVDEARAAHPEAIIEATGPWPPYHFSSVDLTLEGWSAS